MPVKFNILSKMDNITFGNIPNRQNAERLLLLEIGISYAAGIETSGAMNYER